MPSPETDSATIDAWLAGELSNEEEAAIDQYFEEHPEELPISSPVDEGLLGELSAESDPELTDLVSKVKTSGPECGGGCDKRRGASKVKSGNSMREFGGFEFRQEW